MNLKFFKFLVFPYLILVLSLFVNLSLFSSQAFAIAPNCTQYLSQSNEEDVLKRVLNGARIFEQNAGSTVPLDKTTIENLELDKLILSPITDLAPTSLGRNRIIHLVQNPILEVEQIRERQDALKELMADSKLSSDVYEMMKEAEQIKNCLMNLDNDFREGAGLSLGNAMLGTSLSGSFCAVGLLGFAMSGDWRMLAFVLKSGVIQLAFPNLERHISAKTIFTQGKKIALRIKNSQSKELQRIYSILNSLNEADDPFGMKAVLSGLNRLAPNEISRYLQSFTHTRALVSYFGYKKVKKWKANLALYFSAWAELEAYITATKFLKEHQKDLVIPEILDQELTFLDIQDGHHPHHFFTPDNHSQENSARLDSNPASDDAKTYIITGPNAGGKTTYLRMVAINILLAQAGFPVAAQSMSLTPMQVATNFTVIDNTQIGNSTFMSQSLRVRDIFALISNGKPTFIALDEVLNGTSQREHNSAEHAVLEELNKEINAIMMLATHDRTLTELADELPKVENLQVSYRGFEILPGPSTIYNADEVMERAGVPKRVLDNMRRRLNKPQ